MVLYVFCRPCDVFSGNLPERECPSERDSSSCRFPDSCWCFLLNTAVSYTSPQCYTLVYTGKRSHTHTHTHTHTQSSAVCTGMYSHTHTQHCNALSYTRKKHTDTPSWPSSMGWSSKTSCESLITSSDLHTHTHTHTHTPPCILFIMSAVMQL